MAWDAILGRRASDWANGRDMILAVDAVSPGVTEGYLVVDQYLEAAAELPGLVGYAYDPGATRDSP
jgi:hypothetical protein